MHIMKAAIELKWLAGWMAVAVLVWFGWCLVSYRILQAFLIEI